MKKVIVFICMVVVLTALMMSMGLNADEVVEGACGDTFNYSTDKYDNVTWSLNTQSGVLTISGEGKMGSWSWSNVPWGSYARQIKSVVIKPGVTNISDYSFVNFFALTEISIPSSVTSIECAFQDCTALESVYITDIEAWLQIKFSSQNANPLYRAKTLYLNGKSVTELTIPSGVTEISDYAFFGYAGLTRVTLPNGLTTIGKSAFSNCPSLKKINVPSSVRTIAEGAFLNSQNIVEKVNDVSYVDKWVVGSDSSVVKIREGTVGIADMSLGRGYSKITVHVPSTLKIVGYNEVIASKVYIADLAAWCKIDFQTFLSSNATLYVNNEPVTELVIPGSVTSITANAFRGCREITSVKISKGVVSIGESAFAYCRGVESVELPSTLTSIGNHGFQSCESLQSIALPEGIISIGEEAFYECSSLESIYFPASLSSIGKGAFNFCGNLKSAHISDIAAWCAVIFHDRYAAPALNGAQFYLGGEVITKLEIPNGVTTISDFAFYCFQDLTEITLPDSLVSIGAFSFSYCKNLKSIRFSSNLAFIGEYAFDECVKLESIELPSTITTIENYVFRACKALRQIDIPKNVTSIGEYAFFGCSALTTIRTCASLTSIGANALGNCNKLKNIVFCGTQQQWQAISKDHSLSSYKISYHAWDTGVITEEHSASAVGKKTYTCDACKETKVQDIGHSYSAWTQHDEATHERSCACSDTQSSAHVYNNNTCRDCGYVKVQDTPITTVTTTTTPEVTTSVPLGIESVTDKPESPKNQEKNYGCRSITAAGAVCLLLIGFSFILATYKKKNNSENRL